MFCVTCDSVLEEYMALSTCTSLSIVDPGKRVSSLQKFLNFSLWDKNEDITK